MSEPTVTIAGLEGWRRATHLEEVWGTVVTFDIRGEDLDDSVDEVIRDGAALLHQVDAWFSTYRVDTPITALRNGLMTFDQVPAVVQAVLNNCAYVRDLTDGVFDPWAVEGGVDPSGYVKGWAADVVADMMVERGYGNVSVNAAGDVTCRGFQSPDQPWVIGIRHPEFADQIVRTAEVFNEAIATSGLYERGAHIRNPHTNKNEVSLTSATIVGPDGGIADALATAMTIEGTDGIRWFSELPGWSCFLIAGEDTYSYGPAFTEVTAEDE